MAGGAKCLTFVEVYQGMVKIQKMGKQRYFASTMSRNL